MNPIRVTVILAALLVPAFAEPRADRTVILVSVDGLAHYYFDDPKAHMPTIRELAAEGARAKTMTGSFPTVTWPNHTTLVTGVHPGKHGVIGNSYFDRAQRKTIPLLPDPLFDKEELVTAPSIYDVAFDAGLKTAGVIWPASRAAKKLNWQVSDVFDQQMFESTGTASLFTELKAKGIPYEKQMEWCKAGNPGKPMRDWLYTRICEHIITTHKPNVLLLHLVSVDALEHATGRQTPEAYWAISDSDRCIRELIDAVEAAGLKDRTAFFICSDHGFITYTKKVLPNVILRQEGVRRGLGEGAYASDQGGGCFIYLLDDANKAETAKKLAERFRAVEGIETVIEATDFAKFGHRLPSEDPREPDLMLSAKDGYAFGGEDSGQEFIVPTKTPLGTHGYSPFHPLMGANFVASGAGIKEGVVLDQVNSTDVAPTMAAILGLEMKDVEGRVLKEILKD